MGPIKAHLMPCKGSWRITWIRKLHCLRKLKQNKNGTVTSPSSDPCFFPLRRNTGTLWSPWPGLVVLDAQTRTAAWVGHSAFCVVQSYICSSERSPGTVVQFPFPNSDRLLGTFPEDVERYQSNFYNSCKQQHQLCRTNHWICRIPRSTEPPPCIAPDAKIWQQQLQLWQGLFISWHFIFSCEWNGSREDWVKPSFFVPCAWNNEGMHSVTAIK